MNLSGQSTKTEIITKWDGSPHKVSTLSHRSRLPVSWTIADRIAGTDIAHAIAAKGQTLSFFSYAVGDQIPTGYANEKRTATDLDTTLTTARRITGDGAVEKFEVSAIGHRVRYDDSAFSAAVTNETVRQAYRGNVRMQDPAAVVKPRQTDSPFNSEDVLFQALIDSALVSFNFGNGSRIVKLGTVLEMPGHDARSFLRANGQCGCAFKLPEGVRLTDEQGNAQRDFQVDITLGQDVVVPVNLVRLLGVASGTPGTLPTAMATDIELRLGGVFITEGAGTC